MLIAACGPADNDPGPGGVTVGEARILDEAAATIEAGRLPDGAPTNDGERPGDDSLPPSQSPAMMVGDDNTQGRTPDE